MESKKLFRGKRICIIGTGGFAREVYCCLVDVFQVEHKDITDKVVFLDLDEKCMVDTIMGIPLIKESFFDPKKYVAFIGAGDPIVRQRIYNKYPTETEYATIVHPSAIVSQWAEIGEGSIVCAGTIITCNIKIGKQAHLNLYTTIGHDCEIGDFFTTAPGVNISGNNTIGKRVYFGTNSCSRQGISICDDVVIGMNAGVVGSINNAGTYVGTPAKLLE